ncbi:MULTISPECIES: aldehyde dehydrogenase family protein [Micrococcaceae]|uniref:aldehyde dehydrogenase family protein n=1 Tax=Micrococcaceae TaxID=1268 RepID=UPI00160B9E54|nr:MULTISPECIES: aldehyde dehydrogenase family protein [Micrococcaceae]MBB5747918.1 acyl-CoA reductase-like NAD-dependent aldehyde dehydrogenase [Micrococcus sp. TA1]HRO30008.1 aldehyde dehydrogenase family protein [Citricoccus sp.]HRO94484.1 aldehyde dehydrogenase family protein [Citricoccus sp.]
MSHPHLSVLRAENAQDIALPELGHVIGGRVTQGDAGGSAAVMDPSRGTRIGNIGLGSAADVDAAVAAARSAQPEWAALTPRRRADRLLALARALADDAQAFQALESLNCGKPAEVAEDDVASAVDTLSFMAGAGRTATAPAPDEYVEGVTSLIRREPVGVVGAITPWNYPLLMAVWKLAPALMAGNAVVLKPSEITPLTLLRFAQLSAGILPPGVLNVVLGDGPGVGEALSGHPGVDLVALTGSVRAGTAVARNAAGTLKRVHLELGGKAPVVILPDADLDLAATTVAEAGYWNSGQECGAACRVLVHSSIVEAFGELLVGKVSEYVLAEPGAPTPARSLGPMISQAHFGRVRQKIAEAVGEGAEVLLGGGSDDSRGYWVEPTVLKVPQGAAVTRDEVFGPVVSIEEFDHEAEAVSRANDTDYGLTASVFTRDLAAGMSVMGALDFGSVNVNTHLALPTEMPWGGFKRSGYGRDLSAYALDDFSRTKHVALNVAR